MHQHAEKLTPDQRKKIDKVMDEYRRGLLYSGSGGKVQSPDQALAIAYKMAGVPMRHE